MRIPQVFQLASSAKTTAVKAPKAKTAGVSIAIALISLMLCGDVYADEIKIAVASNFNNPIKYLAKRFESQSGHKTVLIVGSTGKHYAQIKHGAPYDVFLAADAARAKRLEDEGVAMRSSRFTYAIGKVVLWSPQAELIDDELTVLNEGRFKHLAIANPKLAPYGKAAQEVLQKRGLWKSLRHKMVKGESIGQTYQFVKSGNAELGFVAYSQVKHHIGNNEGSSHKGSLWIVPQALYTPIEQQAVLLKDSAAAREFLFYLKSDESRRVIESFGYGSL
ncbi:molybdate ABC transporter substrate-binding protein [Alkalimarinus coralli]|uniref:molybdate ABC transporter substrate-binding protein n=1 Tax=Alkalimarinus coralli TaxID=2935863 RepID=UPI00202B1317|nr:molybdate ABC transporter substrate-binding protein [Alkalimarinus coralli]